MNKTLWACTLIFASGQTIASTNLDKQYASCSGVYLYNSEMMGLISEMVDAQKNPDKFQALKKREKLDNNISTQFIKKALYDGLSRSEAMRLKDSAYKAQEERQTRGRISKEAMQQGMVEYKSTLAQCEKHVDDVY